MILKSSFWLNPASTETPYFEYAFVVITGSWSPFRKVAKISLILEGWKLLLSR